MTGEPVIELKWAFARLSADRRNECARQLVVDELILQQRGEHPGEAEACADGEVPAPCNVGRVVADRAVESSSGFKCQAVKHLMVATGLTALAVLARRRPRHQTPPRRPKLDYRAARTRPLCNPDALSPAWPNPSRLDE